MNFFVIATPVNDVTGVAIFCRYVATALFYMQIFGINQQKFFEKEKWHNVLTFCARCVYYILLIKYL